MEDQKKKKDIKTRPDRNGISRREAIEDETELRWMEEEERKRSKS